jgi:pyruvate/2-oxoglutarate dehydrogenase complex dihydrolipoamide acyltransferase (E2) component
LTPIVLDQICWDGVEEGTEALVESWLVEEGANVSAGQPIVTVVVVKTNYEVVAPVAGVLARILVPAEGTFPPGAALAELEA